MSFLNDTQSQQMGDDFGNLISENTSQVDFSFLNMERANDKHDLGVIKEEEIGTNANLYGAGYSQHIHQSNPPSIINQYKNGTASNLAEKIKELSQEVDDLEQQSQKCQSLQKSNNQNMGGQQGNLLIH